MVKVLPLTSHLPIRVGEQRNRVATTIAALLAPPYPALCDV
jgi:hypothetical protein